MAFNGPHSMAHRSLEDAIPGFRKLAVLLLTDVAKVTDIDIRKNRSDRILVRAFGRDNNSASAIASASTRTATSTGTSTSTNTGSSTGTSTSTSSTSTDTSWANQMLRNSTFFKSAFKSSFFGNEVNMLGTTVLALY